MKSFLYAAMAASLLLTAGCGQKKEIKPVATAKAQTTEIPNINDMSDEELLALLEAEANNMDDEDGVESEDDLDDEAMDMEDDEDEDGVKPFRLSDLSPEDTKAMEDIFKNMTPEEIKQVEMEAAAELAELLAMDSQKSVAMGEDQFNPAFDLEKMTPEERQQLVAWQAQAAEWATEQLKLAQQESSELGLESVEFAPQSTELTDEQEAILQKNIEVARAALAEGRELVISGHAEADAEDPLSLSQLRAESLKNALVAAGLDADHIHSTGYGSALSELSGNASAADFIIC